MDIDTSRTIFSLPVNQLILPLSTYIQILAYSITGFVIFHLVDRYSNIQGVTSRKRYDSINRYISSFYAYIVLILGSYDYFFRSTQCSKYNDSLYTNCITFSIGYFIYDFIVSYKYGILCGVRTLHHTIVILSEYECLVLNSGGFLITRWALYLEIANPQLQYRFILQNLGKTHTKHYLFWEMFYFASYILSRILYINFAIYFHSNCKNDLTFMMIAEALLLLQSLYLIYYMYKTTRSRLREYKERKSKGISYYWFEINPRVHELHYVQKKKEHADLKKLNQKEKNEEKQQ